MFLATESWRSIYKVGSHFEQLETTCSGVSAVFLHALQLAVGPMELVRVQRHPSCVARTFLTAVDDSFPSRSHRKDVCSSIPSSERRTRPALFLPSHSSHRQVLLAVRINETTCLANVLASSNCVPSSLTVELPTSMSSSQ